MILTSNYGNIIMISEAAPANSLITKLPGFTASFPSKHYSGYVSYFHFYVHVSIVYEYIIYTSSVLFLLR